MEKIATPAPTSVDKILDENASTITDYYKVLGCDRTSTKDQIIAEYKARVRNIHPDKMHHNNKPVDDVENGKNEPELHKTGFAEFHEAYRVLSTDPNRVKYDRYLASGLNIDYQTWQTMNAHRRVLHWAVPVKQPQLDENPHQSN